MVDDGSGTAKTIYPAFPPKLVGGQVETRLVDQSQTAAVGAISMRDPDVTLVLSIS